MASFSEIRRFLQRVRRRLELANAVEGLVFLALALVGGAAAVVLAAWIGEHGRLDLIRLVGAGAGVVVVIGTLLRYVLLPWRRYRRLTEVARHVELALGDTRGGVLSCVELEHQLPEIQSSGRFSLGLIGALAEDTARRLTHVQPSALVSWRRARRMGQVFALVTLTLALVIMVFPAPFSEGARALMHGPRPETRAEWGDSVEQRSVVVGDITYTLTYPAYTRLPARVVPNSSGDIAALIGTQVRIETQALEPAASARLVFEGEVEHPIELEVGPEGRLTGALTVKHARVFSFQIVRPDGVTVVEKARRTLEAEQDAPPSLELLRPEADIEVQTRSEVRLYFSAADDYGLTGIDLVTHLLGADDPPQRRRLENLTGERTLVGEGSLDLARINLLPGESVEIWLEAQDNNTVTEEHQRTASRRIRVKLHSAEERHKEILDLERKLIEMMIDLLADRLESPIEDQRLSHYNTLVNAQSRVTRATGQMLVAFLAVVAALKADPLANENFRADLEEILNQQDGLHQREIHHVKAAMGELRTGERAQHLAVLSRSNEAGVAQLEHDIIFIEKIVDQQHQKMLVEQARRFREAQQEIMELLQELKNNPDEALRMQIQQRLAQLMKQVDQLMRDMRRNAKPMPYENVNMDALEPGEQMQDVQGMRTKMQEMQEALRNGELDKAMQLMESLGNELQALTTSLEQDLQELAQGGEQRRSAALQRAMADLDKVIHRQEAVHRDTAAMEEAARQQLSEMVREELAPRIARQLEDIQDLTRRLQKVEPDDLHERDVSALSELQQAAQDLKETLSQEDLGQALKMARELHKGIRALEREVETGAQRMREAEGDTYRARRWERNERRLDRAGDKARDIARALEKMMPGPDDLLDRGEQRRLNRLAERQQRVSERVQRMRERVSELESESPGLGARLEEGLQQAESAMGEAQQRLQQHQPGKAEGHEQQALDGLQEARRAIEQAMGDPKRGGGQGVGISRPDSQVDIPEADRYAVPKEFRDELLRALKERAPSRYRRLIEQYYEALVQ